MNKEYLNTLRKVRRDKEYSQEYIASKLNISQKAYSDIESGKTIIKNDLLLKLAEILDVNLDILCNLSDYCNSIHKLKNKELVKLLIKNNIEIPNHLR